MLRIEDTDKKREVPGSRKIICDIFNRIGLKIDEGVISETEEIGAYGPYVQSQRVHIYHVLAKYLVEQGYAYPCFATEEELAQLRDKQEANKEMTGYYGQYAVWRDRSIEDIKAMLDKKCPYVLRFRVPEDAPKRIEVIDVIKAKLDMDNNFNDFVLLKTDGIPTYHFAHACDDYLMGTTYVLRGDEWVASLPIHVELFNALGFKLPQYGHVAPVMKNDEGSRRKLSKRKDPESNAEFYLEKGYPAKALFVYLLTLINSNFEEWYTANKDKDLSEFEVKFENMGVSGPLYDLAKLDNISAEIIYDKTASENEKNLLDWAHEFNPELEERFKNNLELVKKIFATQGFESKEHRKDLVNYSSFMDSFGYFFNDIFSEVPENLHEKILENVKEEDLSEVVDGLIEYFNQKRNGSEETMKDLGNKLRYTDKKHYKADPDSYRGMIMHLYHILNLALTHQENCMSSDDIVSVLGYDEVIRRLNLIK
jgi:glutamyl-tRNA synthetase